MALTSENLTQELLELTLKNLNSIKELRNQSIENLNYKPNPDSWSVLECIEHLNRYGDFYIPEISKRIIASKHESAKYFKSNWLGNYFSKAVSYHEKINKMKTFKEMNPLNANLTINTIDKFIDQQHQIIELLDQSKSINLDKTKTSITISKLIKLRLGDTFRILINHNERHIKQAENVLNNIDN